MGLASGTSMSPSAGQVVSRWPALVYVCLFFFLRCLLLQFSCTLGPSEMTAFSYQACARAQQLPSSQWSQGSMISEMKQVTANRGAHIFVSNILLPKQRCFEGLLMLDTIPHRIWVAHDGSHCFSKSWVMGSLHWKPHQY